jgi:hypothetical protein
MGRSSNFRSTSDAGEPGELFPLNIVTV